MAKNKANNVVDVTPGAQANVPTTWHSPHFIDLEMDAEFPPGIQEAQGETSDVPMEWEPKNNPEAIMGYLRRKNKMSLGGMAYVIEVCKNYTDRTPTGMLCLLTKGGRVLESRIEALNVQIGDLIAIVYRGFGEAKEGQNAPRLYDVKKLKV